MDQSPPVVLLNDIVEWLLSNKGKEKGTKEELEDSNELKIRLLELHDQGKAQTSSENRPDLSKRSLTDRLKDWKITDDSEALDDEVKRTRKEALKRFNNDNLNIQERMFKLFILVIATLIENLHYPEEALLACKLHLEQLHSMTAVKESFKIILNKRSLKKREEPAITFVFVIVCLVNQAIYKIAHMAGRPEDGGWPCVDDGKDEIIPLPEFNKSVAEGLHRLGMKEHTTPRQESFDEVDSPPPLHRNEVKFRPQGSKDEARTTLDHSKPNSTSSLLEGSLSSGSLKRQLDRRRPNSIEDQPGR